MCQWVNVAVAAAASDGDGFVLAGFSCFFLAKCLVRRLNEYLGFHLFNAFKSFKRI